MPKTDERRVRSRPNKYAKRLERQSSTSLRPLAEPNQFKCRHCGMTIVCAGGGTEHRNHCPNCLHSVHLDVDPGDRQADCGGLMEPIAVWVRKGGEWAVIHRCRVCGALSSNRIAADDHDALLVSLAAKPLASPPFPLERLVR
ncbi:MAG TPA: RNHCP domain-containing protein [Fimbriimonadaceae bacterium]|nr:RNHCP domain-containing protein [Fimbriimonadaceae bacterium]